MAKASFVGLLLALVLTACVQTPVVRRHGFVSLSEDRGIETLYNCDTGEVCLRQGNYLHGCTTKHNLMSHETWELCVIGDEGKGE